MDFVILTFSSVSIEIGQKKRNYRETGLMPVSEIIRCSTHVLLYFETHQISMIRPDTVATVLWVNDQPFVAMYGKVKFAYVRLFIFHVGVCVFFHIKNMLSFVSYNSHLRALKYTIAHTLFSHILPNTRFTLLCEYKITYAYSKQYT